MSDTTRSWRSAEDGVNTILECYSAVLNSLKELRSSSGDSTTVNLAASLLHRLQEFDVVVTLFILQSILSITGPVSRLLQGVACDFGVAAALINGCISQFRQHRDSADEQWQKILTKAKEFAAAHNIPQDFSKKRPRKVKRMAGEISQDKQVQNREVAFKTNEYVYSQW